MKLWNTGKHFLIALLISAATNSTTFLNELAIDIFMKKYSFAMSNKGSNFEHKSNAIFKAMGVSKAVSF